MTTRDRVRELRRVRAGDLRPNPKNWRRHPQAQRAALESVLKEVGYADAVIARERPDGELELVDGHLRSGMDPDQEIPVLVVDLTDAEADVVLATLDPLAAMAETDHSQLRELLDGMARDARELVSFFAHAQMPEVTQDEVPEPPARATTRAGDLWVLGDHRLLCADTRNAKAVKGLMAGEPIDFLFTSPPYNVGLDYESHDDVTVAWPAYETFLRRVLKAWLAHLGEGRAVGWNIGSSPKTFPYRQAMMLEDFGLQYTRTVIWKKVGVPMPLFHNTEANRVARNFTPNYMFEFVLIASKGELERGAEVAFDETLRDDVVSIQQTQATVDVPKDGSGKPSKGPNQGLRAPYRGQKPPVHPAVFPVKLPAAFIAHMADAGAIVADPFMGAGTTLIAAEQLGRRGYGIDIEPRYCDVAVERWENLVGHKAKRIRA